MNMNTIDTTTPPPTPETDAFILANAGLGPTDYQWREHGRRLERERDEAREQLEREQMRLVACDVVAMSDTESSRGPARDMHENYWSAAVESVIRRVDECIELRKQLEDMREAIREAHRFIRNIVTNHECGSIVDAHGESALAKLKPFLP